MQENGHINNHHHKSSNSLHLLRAYKVPGPVFKHFPYLVFTITREESTTIIPSYRGENCLSDLLKASVYESWYVRTSITDSDFLGLSEISEYEIHKI